MKEKLKLDTFQKFVFIGVIFYVLVTVIYLLFGYKTTNYKTDTIAVNEKYVGHENTLFVIATDSHSNREQYLCSMPVFKDLEINHSYICEITHTDNGLNSIFNITACVYERNKR